MVFPIYLHYFPTFIQKHLLVVTIDDDNGNWKKTLNTLKVQKKITANGNNTSQRRNQSRMSHLKHGMREKNAKQTQNMVKNPFLCITKPNPNIPKKNTHIYCSTKCRYTYAPIHGHAMVIRLICSSLSGWRLEWSRVLLHTSLTRSLCIHT